MSKTPSTSGKGDKRRVENAAAVRARWDDIDWHRRELAPKRSLLKDPQVIKPTSDLDSETKV